MPRRKRALDPVTAFAEKGRLKKSGFGLFVRQACERHLEDLSAVVEVLKSPVLDPGTIQKLPKVANSEPTGKHDSDSSEPDPTGKID